MDFFDKLGKKASEAYKVTADKTGKIAKETKLKFKISELKSKIEEIYEEIGKKVYEKHVAKEEISIEKDLAEQCNNIDQMSNEIEKLLQECLELKDKKQCPECFKEIDKNMKFCPECGAKQETEQVKEPEIIIETTENSEDIKSTENINQNEEDNNFQQEEPKVISSDENEFNNEEEKTNLEKTTEIEIKPDAQDITEEEMKNLGN